MSPIIVALKSLYVALGGKLTDYYAGIAGGIPVSQMVLTADLIECLSKLSIGIELPAVTAADNGDVLTVVGGKWEKAAAAGGKTLYSHTVTFSFDDDIIGPCSAIASVITDSSTALTLDTLIEVVGAHSNGIPANGDKGGGGAGIISLTVNQSKLYMNTYISSDAVPAGTTITDTVVEI